MDARNSGDTAAIDRASERVIALALVEMAKLRLDEKDYDDAIRLCEKSLKFEDTAETRVEIAIANLYAKKPSEAVKQAASAAEMDPQNPLAWSIKGDALLQSRDYAQAAAAFNKALEIKRDAQSMYALGTAQLGMGEKQEAAETFSQYLALTGDFGWSRVLVGRAYQGNALLQEAEMEFQKALLLDPATRNAHYFWALTLLQANSWNPDAEVYAHLRAELQLSPRHFEANYVLGSLASTARNYRESDQYLHLASQVKPSVPETWVLLGLNAQRRKADQAAVAYFRKAIELGKNLDPNEHYEIRKAYVGLGRLLMASGKAGEGEELLNKARELQAQSMAADQKSFAATNKQGGEGGSGADAPYIPKSDFDRRPSLSSPETKAPMMTMDSPASARATSRSPSDPDGKTEMYLRTVLGASFNDLATAEALAEKYQEAFENYREAARWNPQVPGLQRNLGLAAYFAGQPEEAIRPLAKVVRGAPGDAHARAVLGLAYYSSNDFAKAVNTISPIANRAAQDPQLGLAWAKSLSETGNKIGAARALESVQNANATLSVENLIQVGQLWLELREPKKAERAFRDVLAANPANAGAKCALGIALLRLSRPQESADLFLSVLADHPDYPEAVFQLGQASIGLGNLPQAIHYLEEASQLQPARLAVHQALENAYLKADRKSDADREHVLCESLKIARKKAALSEVERLPK